MNGWFRKNDSDYYNLAFATRVWTADYDPDPSKSVVWIEIGTHAFIFGPAGTLAEARQRAAEIVGLAPGADDLPSA